MAAAARALLYALAAAAALLPAAVLLRTAGRDADVRPARDVRLGRDAARQPLKQELSGVPEWASTRLAGKNRNAPVNDAATSTADTEFKTAASHLPDIQSVPVSGATGSLPASCRVTIDVQRKRFLRNIAADTPCKGNTELCQGLRNAIAATPSRSDRPCLVLTTYGNAQAGMLASFATAVAAIRVPALAVAVESGASRLGDKLPIVVVDGLQLGRTRLERKWAALALSLEAGIRLVYADVDVVFGINPFDALSGDSDMEVLSEGWEVEDVRGHVMGSDDPAMGWSRYCETLRAAFISPALFGAMPTVDAAAVCRKMATQASTSAPGWSTGASASWSSDAAEAEALSLELLAPSHDATTRVGASVRVLPHVCFLNARAAQALLPRAAVGQRFAALLVGRDGGGDGGGGDGGVAATERHVSAVEFLHRGARLSPAWAVRPLLPTRWTLERTRIDPLMRAPPSFNESKTLVLRSRCKRQPTTGARRLHWLVEPDDAAWPTNCEEQPELCALVKRVAVDRRVMAAVSNGNILHMLGQFVDIVESIGIANFMVVALDDRTAQFLSKRRTPHYLRPLRSRSGSTDNHATSGLKFSILAELLSVGVSVLLSDVDVVFTQNPFPALYADADVEGMSDGWDELSAYGHTHTLPLPMSTQGPLRSIRLVARNSGLFYLSATHQALRMMKTLAQRMASEDVWDQSAYNQEMWRLAYADKAAAGVSTRVMNYLCFMNTKTLFRYMRHDEQLRDIAQHKPVSIHVNYHPEKELRMESIKDFYLNRKASALDAWNGGEGRNTHSCIGKVGLHTNSMPMLTEKELQGSRLARSIIEAAEEWEWSGRGPFRFGASGAFEASWGRGEWGTVPSQWRKDSLYVRVEGEIYILMFLSEKWSFVALRCSDEQVTFGQLRSPDVPQNRLVW